MGAEGCRLILILPPLVDASFSERLRDALDAADIACVLGRFAGSAAKATARALATIAQDAGAAFLVDDDIDLALASGADGVHVAGAAAARAAAKRLKPDAIVGVGMLHDRDAAMTAGEIDVDYLMFGEPQAAVAGAALVERVGWWAEIFTVPCVAYAAHLADVGPLAAAVADFVALSDAVWHHPRGVAAALATAQAALAVAEPAT